jgi:membrane protein DedA with SNARE-associated domain
MKEIIFSLLGDLVQLIETYNYALIIFLMAIESSFIPFPSEIVMIPAGYLVAKGTLEFAPVVLSGIAGSVIGALINYYIARTLGLRFLKKFGKYFFMGEAQLGKIIKFFENHGRFSTLTGRLIPGLRQYISFPAGIAKMPLDKFIVYTSIGAGIWMLVLTILGVLFGHNEELLKEYLKEITLITMGVIFVAVLIYFIVHKKIVDGRKLK